MTLSIRPKKSAPVRNTADTANTKIADVSTDVGTVKTNLASTNADLQKTIADLNAVLPPTWSHANPIDIIGDAGGKRYTDALNTIAEAVSRVVE